MTYLSIFEPHLQIFNFNSPFYICNACLEKTQTNSFFRIVNSDSITINLILPD